MIDEDLPDEDEAELAWDYHIFIMVTSGRYVNLDNNGDRFEERGNDFI